MCGSDQSVGFVHVACIQSQAIRSRSGTAIGHCVRHGPGLLVCCRMHVAGARCMIISETEWWLWEILRNILVMAVQYLREIWCLLPNRAYLVGCR